MEPWPREAVSLVVALSFVHLGSIQTSERTVKLALRGTVTLRAKSTLRAKFALRGAPAAPGTPARGCPDPKENLGFLYPEASLHCKNQ